MAIKLNIMTKEERKQKRAQRRDRRLRRRMVMRLLDNRSGYGPDIIALYEFINGNDSKLLQYEKENERERDLRIRMEVMRTMLKDVQEAPLVKAYLNGDDNAMPELQEFRRWRDNKRD